MQKVVIDSNIIIDHFRIGSAPFNKLLEEAKQGKLTIYLPAVVYTEINSGQDSNSPHKLKEIAELPEIFELSLADKIISQNAGFLLRDYPKLSLADAIVAATTIVLNAKLATRNKKDFEGIKGLKFFRLLK